ncbi:MAG: hypothetical protein ACN6PR_22745 [Achromobacter sp.]
MQLIDYVCSDWQRASIQYVYIECADTLTLNNGFVRVGCAERISPLLMAKNENTTWFCGDRLPRHPASAPCPWVVAAPLWQALLAAFRRMNRPCFNNIKMYQLAPVLSFGWYPSGRLIRNGWYPIFRAG